MRSRNSRKVPDLTKNKQMYSIMHDPYQTGIMDLQLDDFIEQEYIEQSMFKLSQLEIQKTRSKYQQPQANFQQFNDSKNSYQQRQRQQFQINPNVNLSPQRNMLRLQEKLRQQTARNSLEIHKLSLTGETSRPASSYNSILIRPNKINRKGSRIDLLGK